MPTLCRKVYSALVNRKLAKAEQTAAEAAMCS
jgi:hypothetical protein